MGGFRISDLAPAIAGGAAAFGRRPAIGREAFRAAIEEALAEENIADVRRRGRFEAAADPFRLGLLQTQSEAARFRLDTERTRAPIETGRLMTAAEREALGLRTEEERAPIQTRMLLTQADVADIGLAGARRQEEFEKFADPFKRKGVTRANEAEEREALRDIAQTPTSEQAAQIAETTFGATLARARDEKHLIDLARRLLAAPEGSTEEAALEQELTAARLLFQRTYGEAPKGLGGGIFEAPPALDGGAVRDVIQRELDQAAVPPAAAATGSTTPVRAHTVRRGETLSTIARRAGTTVRAIVDLNPGITNPDRIREGQVIRLPGGR